MLNKACHDHRELELISEYNVVESIDNNNNNNNNMVVLPDGVYILNMMDAQDKAENFCAQGGGDQVFGFNGGGGYVSWKLERGGTYYIFCQMTAADARPLFLWTVVSKDNDESRLISKDIAAGVTGSWASDALQWFHYGPFELQGDSIKVDTDGFWPHVKRFVLIPTTDTPAEVPASERTTLVDDREPDLLQISHAGVAERLASIPDRPLSGTQRFVAVLRQPKHMSDNVQVGGTMIIVEGGKGYYEFEFINECWAEEVYLDVTYSSGDSRPITIVINGGDAVAEHVCSAATGGYGPDDFVNVRCGPYPIQSEVNTVRVTSSSFFPHVGEIRVVDVAAKTDSNEHNNVTEAALGTWIVPPSRPMRQDLVASLKSFCFMENTQEPNPDFEPDPDFYNGINCDGFWVLASKEVDKRILNCAAELICRYIPVEIRRLCLEWRAPLDMPQGPFRLVILDPVTNQQAGDCPDFPDAWPGRNGTANPGIFTSADDFCLDAHRPRRVGSSPCGELTVHEVTHGLDLVIRQQLDPYFFQEVDDCYRAAVERLVYKKAYAAADRHEYLAEICTLFVGTNPGNFERGCFQCSESGVCDWEPHHQFPPGKCGVPFRKKSDLIANDLLGYELLKSFLIEIKDPEDDSFWWE